VGVTSSAATVTLLVAKIAVAQQAAVLMACLLKTVLITAALRR